MSFITRSIERLTLTEAMRVYKNAPAKSQPPPGMIIAEVFNTEGGLLASDTFKATKSAPRGVWRPNGPATFVSKGHNGLCHQEFAFAFSESHPVELPAHQLSKADLGASLVKIKWSCER